METRITRVIEFIKGSDNIIADSLSRLCLLHETAPTLTEEQILHALDEEKDEQLNALTSKIYIIPQEYKELMSQFHNSQVGHHGVEKTIDLLLQNGHIVYNKYYIYCLISYWQSC
jgi:hypothetical protein